MVDNLEVAKRSEICRASVFRADELGGRAVPRSIYRNPWIKEIRNHARRKATCYGHGDSDQSTNDAWPSSNAPLFDILVASSRMGSFVAHVQRS